jgi:hypothetical protein
MIKEMEFKPTLSLSLSHDGWPLGEFNTKMQIWRKLGPASVELLTHFC